MHSGNGHSYQMKDRATDSADRRNKPGLTTMAVPWYGCYVNPRAGRRPRKDLSPDDESIRCHEEESIWIHKPASK